MGFSSYLWVSAHLLGSLELVAAALYQLCGFLGFMVKGRLMLGRCGCLAHWQGKRGGWGVITSQRKFNIEAFHVHSPPPPFPSEPPSPLGNDVFPENWKNQVLSASNQCSLNLVIKLRPRFLICRQHLLLSSWGSQQNI